MNECKSKYEWFARWLSYPCSEQLQNGSRFEVKSLSFDDSPISNLQSPITHHLREFKKTVDQLTVEDLEELYTRTFDINPIANLEIGWHLYGEQYERGAFLVKMRQMLHRHVIEESSELPDHLTHALLLLGKLEKNEADEFALTYVLPSLKKILEAFKDADNPYKNLLQALMSFLEQKHIVNNLQSQFGVVAHE